VPGELWIGGAGVAMGYWNRPDLTAERFVKPANSAKRVMYRTGDVVRRHPDGRLEFLGRLDNQVKVRGHRIELGEIEAVLRSHPGVRQACVLPEREGTNVKRLVAYCLPVEKVSLSEAALLEHLRSALPQHMLPETIIPLEAFPLTPNGKIDRAKLPSPAQTRAGRTREYVAPDTRQEKQLAEIVGEVLHIERVGVTDNLFKLGADSLQVFQVTSRAVKAGLAITPRMVLKLRTIRGVLGELDAAKSAGVGQTSVIKPVARQKYRATQESS
jgi:aryl carrier-like protein